MKHLLIPFLFLTFFYQNGKAQNVDNDGMYISIESDPIITCSNTTEIDITTCFYEASIVVQTINTTTINPFEILIELAYCKTSPQVAVSCHDTTISFPSLTNGNYKFIVKSSVATCFGGFYAEDMDSIFVAVNNSHRTYNPLNEKDTLCKDIAADQLILDASIGYDWYSWNTGSKDRYLTVEKEGLYYVTVKDDWGCFYSDSILVENQCVSEIYMPSAFTPNNDGLNDEFRVYSKAIILEKMQIFNRWGELIFESDELNDGWNGEDAPSGVYNYKILYLNSNNKHTQLIGVVTLIR